MLEYNISVHNRRIIDVASVTKNLVGTRKYNFYSGGFRFKHYRFTYLISTLSHPLGTLISDNYIKLERFIWPVKKKYRCFNKITILLIIKMKNPSEFKIY